MGLARLEWHTLKDDGLLARVAMPYDTNPDKTKYHRFAHVNVYDELSRRKGKVLVHFRPYQVGREIIWFNSLEAAKLHVEALFALEF